MPVGSEPAVGAWPGPSYRVASASPTSCVMAVSGSGPTGRNTPRASCARDCGAPHFTQNAAPGGVSDPHRGQLIRGNLVVTANYAPLWMETKEECPSTYRGASFGVAKFRESR